MVILSSSGFKYKDKCDELFKLIKNKKVYICNYKNNNDTRNNISIHALSIDEGKLPQEDILQKYDVLYIAEGNIYDLSKDISKEDIKNSVLKFINSGKTLITEGLSSLIALNDLDYLDLIIKKLDEENKIYPLIDYTLLNSLNLSNEKIIIHSDKLSNRFISVCKAIQKQKRIELNFIKDGEFIVL